MWDVAVERQIQVKGPDAADFVDLLITRNVHTVVPTMQARYVILCNEYGGIVNDPVLLRVADAEVVRVPFIDPDKEVPKTAL